MNTKSFIFMKVLEWFDKNRFKASSFSNIKKLQQIFPKNYSKIIYNNTKFSHNTIHIINRYSQESCKECYKNQVSFLLIICNQENILCEDCLINNIISLVKKKIT